MNIYGMLRMFESLTEDEKEYLDQFIYYSNWNGVIRNIKSDIADPTAHLSPVEASLYDKYVLRFKPSKWGMNSQLCVDDDFLFLFATPNKGFNF